MSTPAIRVIFTPHTTLSQTMQKFNRIKVVLVEKDKTAKWLAEKVGRDRSTVSRWCTNDMQPPLEVLYQVADILEVDVRELLWPNEKAPDSSQ